MSPVTGTNFALGSYKKFQPGFWEMRSYGAKFKKQSKHGETFAPIIALVTLRAVSLQFNGMLMMWKIQQAIQDNAIQTTRIHPAFIPVTRLKCSYRKIELSQPTLSNMNTSKMLQRSLNLIEVRRDLGNRASLVNRAYVKRLSVWCQLTWNHLQTIRDCRPYSPLIPVLQATKCSQTLRESLSISRRLSDAI